MPGAHHNLDFNLIQKQFMKCYKAGDFPHF